MLLNRVKYYDSADIMPIGRYMLATCRDLKYFAVGPLPKKINNKHLKKAVEKLNKTILKGNDQKKLIKAINQLVNDEGKLYLHSSLVAVVDFASRLIQAGADHDTITDKLKPIQHLLIERGLSPDSKRNAQRLSKVTRNFIIKSNEIKDQLKRGDADKNKVYESYLRNLILIEKAFNIKINEQTDSINKYVLLIDEINRHGDRLK